MMNTRGFTLIEIMIAVVIIGILAVIAIPNVATMVSRSKEAAVKSNCHTIQLAAEDFALQNDGVYAADVENSQTMTGKTLTDILPNGHLLQNPFTKTPSEPVNGLAAQPGEIGYACVQQNGTNVGYNITAVGVKPNTTILALLSGQ
ncbi:MAG: prepilin-type N-terminal cleavage/methylation domain-containing protein [Candidatus Krumholzibacteriaceae bacterium]